MAGGRKATLAEIMGKGGAEKNRSLGLSDLPELLGEGMPDLQMTRVGRVRLIRALKQRFGDGFRSVPGVSGILKEFDKEKDFNLTVAKMKGIRVRRRNRG